MNSITKFIPFSHHINPVYQLVLINRLKPCLLTKLKVLYYHSRSILNGSKASFNLQKVRKASNTRCLLSRRRIITEQERKTAWQEEKIRKFEFPSIIHIQNLLKTQPNFKWRTLWSAQNEKVLEWPMFDRSKQYESSPDLKIQSLVKSRLNCNLPPTISEKELKEIDEQKYIPHRVKNLGPDLAAVHFFFDRRAAVRLTGQNEWIVGGVPDFTSDEQLIHCIRGGHLDEERYTSKCRIEALDCSNFMNDGIRYEGLKYLSGLRYLKWLSLKNQKQIDAWCLDRIAGLAGNTLEYLDISQCDLDVGCVFALSRMHELQMLIIKEPADNDEVNTALSNLKTLNPKLTVKSIGTEQFYRIPGVHCIQAQNV